MSSLRKHLLVAFSGLVVGMGLLAQEAWCAGMVNEVSVSSDCRRLVLKTEGKPIIEQIFSMNRPARLVVDFKNTRFSGSFKKMRYADQPIREVRVASRGEGMRLVVEFADRDVPEHRFREIDNHMILLLDEFRTTDKEVQRAGMKSLRLLRSTEGSKTDMNDAKDGHDETGLRIKSARVSNGMIVLDVANDRNPEQLYRIDLGVDLKELGFSAAEIRRSKRAQNKRSAPAAPKKGTLCTPKKSTFVPASTRLGLGSLRSNGRVARLGLFEAERLKTRTNRVVGSPDIAVVKKCGYKPK